MQLQSMPDCSPTKWHLAHTAWFFEEFVVATRAGYTPKRPAFRYLFNSYYDAVGDRPPRPQRGLLSRPAVAEILQYRREVDDQVRALLDSPMDDALSATVELGLHHEQQHQELLLTDVLNALSHNALHPAYVAPAASSQAVPTSPLQWTPFAEGLHGIGAADDAFCFDNERPRHRVFLEPFALSSRLVTNGEFRAFIEAGGYSTPALWLSEGLDFVRGHSLSAPLYWRKQDGEWFEFSLHGLVPLDESAPLCCVSFFEADAFARWAGARLPTEFEWEVAAAAATVDGANLLEQRALRTKASSAVEGVSQLFGDVWEWTASSYAPYPGYAPPPGALGEYNGKFMSNQYVLRGGSFATAASHVRRSYRNFFPATARWQFSGLRLARSS